MDRDEAFGLLRSGSVAAWNERRAAGEEIPDLSGFHSGFNQIDASIKYKQYEECDYWTIFDFGAPVASSLKGFNLDGVSLRHANFSQADLRSNTFRDTDLRGANLVGANLIEADLRGANLMKADLSDADLAKADLRKTKLQEAKLYGANLGGADLRGAKLLSREITLPLPEWAWEDERHWWATGADFTESNLKAADFAGSECGGTRFTAVNLSETKGLDSIIHRGPSSVGVDTLIRSRGKIPEAFLRGCGLPDSLITYLPSLLAGMEPIQFYSCFISYSSKDREFAERLHADLQAKGVRCWFAPHDLRIGDRFRLRIDESIRVYDKLLLVLSENSVHSQEVENEVEAAMDREKMQDGTILFPIRLDDAVMRTPGGWPTLVRRSRHIGDFSEWKHHDAYQTSLTRLVRDLQAARTIDDSSVS